MVGGTVTEVIQHDGRVWINTIENKFQEFSDECAIYVELDENSAQVKPGDIVWWHGGSALWTKYENGYFVGPEDVKLVRLGFSGVDRPEVNPDGKNTGTTDPV